MKDFQRLNTLLSEATTTANLTIADIESYSSYLDERLLWIKSTQPISLKEPLEEWKRVAGLFGPANVKSAWGSVTNRWLPHFFSYFFLLLLAAFSLSQRRRIFGWLESANKAAARRNCTSIAPTVRAIGASVLLAAGLPSLIYTFAILIDNPYVIRKGLLNLGDFLVFTGLMFRVTGKDGLFQIHFKISAETSRLIH